MKAKEIKEAIARGETTFAIARNVEKHSLLGTFTVDHLEGSIAVHKDGHIRRPAELMPLAEAERLIAERQAKADAAEMLRCEADDLVDVLTGLDPHEPADDPEIFHVKLTLAQLRQIVWWLRDDGHVVTPGGL